MHRVDRWIPTVASAWPDWRPVEVFQTLAEAEAYAARYQADAVRIVHAFESITIGTGEPGGWPDDEMEGAA